MRKSASLLLSLCLSLGCWLPVQAEEDYSDEDYWYDKCTKRLTSQDDVSACEAFLEYTQSRQDSLSEEIASYTASLAQTEKSAQETEDLILEQRELIQNLTGQIAEKEERISVIEASLEETQAAIDDKQAQIDVLDARIQSRMVSEQASVGTNMIVDILMGSQSLSDMIRRLSGLERITQADQSQVDDLEELKRELDFQKSELTRLSDTLQDEKEELELQKAQAQELETSYEQLAEEYESRMAELKQAKMDAEADFETVKEFTISAQENLANTLLPVDGLIFPITAGSQSAGTWAYPSGGLHLGLDWAAPIGTDVIAPADGLILYANNPSPSDNGYLGNWIGWPLGGGNTVGMLVNLKGTLYFISFCHLSQDGMTVKAGDTVTQGQQIAKTGNSGNSTGPHCHIEIINLGNMSQEEAVAMFANGADFAFGTGWDSSTRACEAGASAPCRERPESLLLG